MTTMRLRFNGPNNLRSESDWDWVYLQPPGFWTNNTACVHIQIRITQEGRKP